MWYDYWVVLLPFILIAAVWGGGDLIDRLKKRIGMKEPKKGDLAPIPGDQWAAALMLQALAIYSAGWKGLLVFPVMTLVVLPFWWYERCVLKIPAKRVK